MLKPEPTPPLFCGERKVFPREALSTAASPLPNTPRLPSYWAFSVVEGTNMAASPSESAMVFKDLVFFI
jgi:hypothetical protein